MAGVWAWPWIDSRIQDDIQETIAPVQLHYIGLLSMDLYFPREISDQRQHNSASSCLGTTFEQMSRLKACQSYATYRCSILS
jgi:hypothetical protein